MRKVFKRYKRINNELAEKYIVGDLKIIGFKK